MHRRRDFGQLDFLQALRYFSPIAATSAIRDWRPGTKADEPPLMWLFFVYSMAPPMDGPCGEGNSSPVPSSGTPTRTVPPTPIGVGESGFTTAYEGGQP